jgi:hypothetical protein
MKCVDGLVPAGLVLTQPHSLLAIVEDVAKEEENSTCANGQIV